MSKSKYYDSTSVIQVIGCSLLNPNLLDEDSGYSYSEYDFNNEFHRIVFGVIKNLHQMGANNISVKDIDNYLQDRIESKGIYQSGKGGQWVQEAIENADLANFDYYYNRMKKMTLLRGYSSCGLDMKFLYDPDNIFDIKKREQQEKQLDELTLQEIADIIESKIEKVKMDYIDGAIDETVRLGDTIFNILEELKEKPVVGSPLYGKYINTIHRGARLGTYYIRSAPSGIGKSRSMIADACQIACNKIFNTETNKWEDNGISQSALYITTEQTLKEITTMCLSFLSGVPEERIILNACSAFEYDRVVEAANIIKESPLYIEEMPDFTMKDVENCIKRNIRNNRVQYVFFDYIQSSVSILGEISRMSGGTKLREDNVLFLLSAKLKDIAVKFNVFVETSSQLNGKKK